MNIFSLIAQIGTLAQFCCNKNETMKKYLNFPVAIVSFLLISSIIFIGHYTHFFKFTPEAMGKYFPVKWIITGHITTGAMALLSGPPQFLKVIRNRSWRLHRLLGYIYLTSVLVSSFCALYLTFVTTKQVGIMYTVSLWFMITVWITATALAYYTIIKRKVPEHEEWMVRSYIITFAFIIQNFILKIPLVMSLAPFPELSPGIFWFSWSIPLFGYQVYLTLKKLKKPPSRL